MSEKIQHMLAGAVGGVSPHIILVATALVSMPKDAQLPPGLQIMFYLLGVLLWASLGGAAAWIWDEDNLRKSFYVGMGLPAFVQLNVIQLDQMLEKRQNAPQEQEASLNLPIGLFSTTAYAQEITEGDVFVNIDKRPITAGKVIVTTFEGDTVPQHIVLHSSGTEKEFVYPLSRQDLHNGWKAIKVPDYVDSLKISYGNSTYTTPLQDNQRRIERFTVNLENNPWSGFWHALGVKSVGTHTIRVDNDPSINALWVSDNRGEDSPEVQALRELGYHVKIVRSTEEALSYYATAPPVDLLVTDVARFEQGVLKPDAGFDLVGGLRQRANTPPIVIYSDRAKGAATSGNDESLIFAEDKDALAASARMIRDAEKLDHGTVAMMEGTAPGEGDASNHLN